MQDSSRIKTQKDSEKLRNWLDSSPRSEYYSRKRELAAAAYVKKSTLHNWLYTAPRIPMAAKVLINEYTFKISGERIFEIEVPEYD